MSKRFSIFVAAFFLFCATSVVMAATFINNTTPGDVPSCMRDVDGDCIWGFTAESDTNFGESVCIEVHPVGDAGNFVRTECSFSGGGGPFNFDCTVDVTSNAAFANTTVEYQYFIADSGSSCGTNTNTFTGFNWNFSSGPNAVRLEYFTATAVTDGVLLEWETSYEVNHSGFNVYRRAANSRDDWAAVNSVLIGSEGSQAQGAIYQFVDDSVAAGSWEYLLEDVENDEDTYRHVDSVATVTTQVPTAVSLTSVSITQSTMIWILSAGLLLITGASLVSRKHK